MFLKNFLNNTYRTGNSTTNMKKMQFYFLHIFIHNIIVVSSVMTGMVNRHSRVERHTCEVASWKDAFACWAKMDTFEPTGHAAAIMIAVFISRFPYGIIFTTRSVTKGMTSRRNVDTVHVLRDETIVDNGDCAR